MDNIFLADAQIIEQYLSGDKDAFTILVKKHRPDIHKYILNCIRDREDTKDICQKVFIKCYRNLAKLRDRSRFKTWLFSIARHHIVDHQRGIVISRTENTEDTDIGDEPLFSSSLSPDRVLDIDFRKKLIYHSIHRLPPAQKEVILLKIYNQLTFAEIAHIVNVSENTVKSRCYYALTSIRNYLKNWKFQEYRYYEL